MPKIRCPRFGCNGIGLPADPTATCSLQQGVPFVEDKFLCTTDWPPNVSEGAFHSLATGAEE